MKKKWMAPVLILALVLIALLPALGVGLTAPGNTPVHNISSITKGAINYGVAGDLNSEDQGAQANDSHSPPGASAPTAVRSLTATAGNAQVVLSWSAPFFSPISNYMIYRGTTSNNETILVTLGNVLNYNDTRLINGQIYYYKVSAKNSVNESPESNEAFATPSNLPSSPLGVSTVAGSDQVNLTWSAPANDGGTAIINYIIYRNTTSGMESLLVTLGNVLNYTDTGLINGQIYYYRVSAVNSIGEGARSNETSATPVTIVFIVYVEAGTYYAKSTATGAVAYSGTNAATVIESAMNALPSGRTTKEKVLLQGSFTLTASLVMPSYTVLELNGKMTLANFADCSMVSAEGKSNFEILGGHWDGNRANQSTWMYNPIIYCSYSSNFTIQGCEIYESIREPINLNTCNHATIDKNNLHDGSYHAIGIYLSCSYVDVTNNTITDFGDFTYSGGGIYVYSNMAGTTAQNINITGNTLTRCTADGISLYPNTASSYVINCVVDGNILIDTSYDGQHASIGVGSGGGSGAPGAAAHGYCNNNTITNNTVYETGTYIKNGYEGGGGTGGFIYVRGDGNIVRGNTLLNSSRLCISVFYGNSNIIDSNVIVNAPGFVPHGGEDAIAISSSYNIISNNQITNPGRYCVSVISGTANQIINNDFTGQNTILNYGTGTKISGNVG